MKVKIFLILDEILSTMMSLGTAQRVMIYSGPRFHYDCRPGLQDGQGLYGMGVGDLEGGTQTIVCLSILTQRSRAHTCRPTPLANISTRTNQNSSSEKDIWSLAQKNQELLSLVAALFERPSN